MSLNHLKVKIFFIIAMIIVIGFTTLTARAMLNEKSCIKKHIIYKSSTQHSQNVPIGISGKLIGGVEASILYRIVRKSSDCMIIEVENKTSYTHNISLIEYNLRTRMIKRRMLMDDFQLKKTWYLEYGSDETGILSTLGYQIESEKDAFSATYYAALNMYDFQTLEAFQSLLTSEESIEYKTAHPGFQIALKLFGITDS